MKAFRLNTISTLLSAAVMTAGVSAVQAQSPGAESTRSSGSVVTVRQAINQFANRYGEPVILHGPLNLSAPFSAGFAQGMTSDQAIAALSRAAGAQAVRVYFVTPASSRDNVTTGSLAQQLVGDSDQISLGLLHVSSEAAISAIAAADNAEVRFPDGLPTGTITLRSSSLPIDRAISIVASKTNTHWSAGYIMEPTTPSTPPLTASTGSLVGSEMAPEGSAVPASSYDENPAAAEAAATKYGWSSQPGALVARDGHVYQLPPEQPLARDAAGNILPITIHVPVTPVVAAATTGKGPSVADRVSPQVQPLNGGATNNESNPTAIPTPGSDLFGGPSEANEDYLGGDFGTVQTYTPNSGPGMSPSGLSFSPNGVAYSSIGYGSGFSIIPGFTW